MRKLAWIFAIVAAAPVTAGFAIEAGEVAEYSAEYEVRYKGRRVARAEFSVAAEGNGQFLFKSSTRARGIWRLASPNEAIELSRLAVMDGRIAPSSFNYEDGSRKGEDNYSLEFEPSAGVVRITGPGGATSVPYQTGLLDRGSLQVALMFELASCRLPGPMRYVDDGSVREYRYERLEDLPADTGIGTLDSVRFSQSREGSSRTTILWLAPELAYLPVVIEQIRGGEIETVFILDSLSGLERAESNCSSLR
jgi:hypothetical protein